MNIFLIGYRCTGKTSAGKFLSEKLGRPFFDADIELVKEQGMTIAEIVNKEGWDAFREKERAVIKRACANDRYVVATGGGAVLDKRNVEQMKKNGVIIWLRAASETIKKRILHDKKTKDLRPSLTSKGLIKEIDETLLNRNPFYKNAMDFFIDTDRLNIDEICNTIIEKLVAFTGCRGQLSGGKMKFEDFDV